MRLHVSAQGRVRCTISRFSIDRRTESQLRFLQDKWYVASRRIGASGLGSD